jgi:hypothetical protein
MRGNGAGLCLLGLAWAAILDPAYGIDVKLTMDDAKQALAAGRAPLEAAYKAKPEERDQEVKKIMQAASLATRVGADPVKDPCGASVILRTKRFWLESFGRTEARETEKQKKEIRMPDDKIQKYLEMPNLEMEVQLCGDDEYFAEGAQVALQQGAKSIKPVDVSPAERGRKNEGQGPAYRSRFTARFAYDSFDPNAKTKIVVFFPDGKMQEVEADFAKVK